MKKIAFIGHPYHLRTKSFYFFYEILKKRFCIDLFFDKSWTGGLPLDIDLIGPSEYDLIVLWHQINFFFHPKIRKHDNVILVPMFDCHARNLNIFKQYIGNNNIRIISFCRALHEACIQFGLNSMSVKFYPNPLKFNGLKKFDQLAGFFWHRRKEISWEIIKKLISKKQILRFYIHTATDRGFQLLFPTEKEIKKFNIIRSEWFDTETDFFEFLSKSNVYFAPRIFEGIGLSFLEAMAMGMCVVAPNFATMNEYIIHGENGLLYDPQHPNPLDFSHAYRLGARARHSIESGHKRWIKSIDDIYDFIDGKPLVKETMQYQAFSKEALSAGSKPSTLHNRVHKDKVSILLPNAELFGGLRKSGIVKKHGEGKPLVTVATVTRNAEKELPVTLASVLDQTYDNIEFIIVDGNSNDRTLRIIKDNEQFIDLWISEPDRGPYDAMNKAAKLARGMWIIFLNAGDWFTSSTILYEIVDNSPAEADIIYGHHYYRHIDGKEEWRKANSFKWTSEMLRKGQLTTEWVIGIPGHQATLTRTSLLRKSGYDIEQFSYAADHDFLFRMSREGCVFHHTDLTIAVYTSGGFSWQNRAECMREQWQISRKYGSRKLVDKFYRKPFRQVKKDQSRISLFFSKEWYFQETSFGGWMRWLSKAGEISFQIEKSSNYFVCFQASSFLPNNVLYILLNNKSFLQIPLLKRNCFFGPKRMELDERVHKLSLISENEPNTLSLYDPRSVSISVKNLIIMEDSLAARFTMFAGKIIYWLAPQFLGNNQSSSTMNRFLNILRSLKTYAVIWKSGLFSSKFYRSQYSKTAIGGIKKSLFHYIQQGARERKNPNSFFDTGYYLDHNPDVAESGINPLYHFIACGAKEGREPSPNISTARYLEMNPDVDLFKKDHLRQYINAIKQGLFRDGHTVEIKNFHKDRICAPSTNNPSHSPQRMHKEDILSRNKGFIDHIRQASRPEKVSLLQKRGKILENFKKDHYLGGIYEEIIKAFYTKYLQVGDVVIDCGAEVGNHTFPLAKIVGSEGLVYAIDARSESIAYIKRRMGLFTRNIRLCNCALSDWDGETKFTTVDNLPGWSSLVPYEKYPKKVALRKHPVKIRRLDNIVDENRQVNFIKLDIEGGEYHALLGAAEIISRYRPILVFENGWLDAANRFHYLLEDFLDFFVENRYELIDILGEPFCREYLFTRHNVNNFVAIPDEFADNYLNLKSFLWYQAVNRVSALHTLD